MPSCVVKFCKNNSYKSRKDQGVTYHSFPSNGPRRTVWINIIRAQRQDENFYPVKYTKICSAHFAREDFTHTNLGYITLKKTAVPDLEIPYGATIPTVVIEATSESCVNGNSDLRSNSDTPQKLSQNDMKRIKLQMRNLIIKNKQITYRNKLLERRVLLLRKRINYLKKKYYVPEKSTESSDCTE